MDRAAGDPIEKLARERLGSGRLRPGQRRAAQALAAGRDVLAVLPPADVPFAVGARVRSERWGEGTVQRYDGDQVTVLFDEHGYRELYDSARMIAVVVRAAVAHLRHLRRPGVPVACIAPRTPAPRRSRFLTLQRSLLLPACRATHALLLEPV